MQPPLYDPEVPAEEPPEPRWRGAIAGGSSRARRWVMGWRCVAGVLLAWLAATFLFPGLAPLEDAGPTPSVAWGWDETMHAELPAVQVLLHSERGEWMEAVEVVHECDRYPFMYPLALAGWQAIVGIGEGEARWLGRLVVAVLAILSVALGRRFAGGDRSRGWDVGLLVALAALSSPLARRYGPSLYLEIPAVTMMAATLLAWIRRRDFEPGTRARVARDLLTGLLAAAAFFTKFNYALMLALALGLDALVELLVARGRLHAWLSLARVAAPVGIGLVWWFVLPLPLGGEVAAEHRNDFMEFVGGNTNHGMAAWLRKTNWLTGVAAHPVLFVTLAVASLGALVAVRTRTTVTLALALAAFVIPIVTHSYQLDRFLLPAALGMWVAGGTGLALALRRFPRAFTALALVVAGLCAAYAPLDLLAHPSIGFPVAPEGTSTRTNQARHVHITLGVFGPPASNGLASDTQEELMDLIAEAVGPEDSVGWLGQSAEVSPASLHLELLARGGSKERFLKYAEGPMDVVLLPSSVREDFTPEELLDYARGFDHVIVPAQGDLIDRPGRRWILEAWHQPLRESPDVTWRTLGSILVDRFNQGPLPVTIDLASARRDRKNPHPSSGDK